MNITLLVVAFCLVVIVAASASRILKAPSQAIASSQQSLLQVQRRAREKHAELMMQAEVARNAWSSVIGDPILAKPVSVMLEIKMIDQIRSRAAVIAEELRLAQKCSPNAAVEEPRKRHAEAWRHIQTLNVCISDVKDSLTRLRSLTGPLKSRSDGPSLAA